MKAKPDHPFTPFEQLNIKSRKNSRAVKPDHIFNKPLETNEITVIPQIFKVEWQTNTTTFWNHAHLNQILKPNKNT